MKLTVADLSKSFSTPAGTLEVLKSVSFEAGSGQTIGIVGPSGSGKSTLLNIIGALDEPTSGSVRLDDIEVTTLKGTELSGFRAKRVGFVFQDHHLLPQCSALENVALPTLAAGNTTDADKRASELLGRVGLAERINAMPAHLSGGERQRVAVARALVNNPALLLCDEPTGNLDAETALLVTRLFVDLAKQSQVCVIMVTHNLQLAGELDCVFELRDGKLSQSTS